MERTDIDARFARFARTKVLVLGDVMLDAYLWGRVDRISPEAPVPVIHVQERGARLGGAANVALNIQALGGEPIVVSMLGDDEQARRVGSLFEGHAMRAEGLLRSSERPTTVKTRVISGHQHIVRVDEEIDTPLSGAESERMLRMVHDIVERERPDVIVFEDYDKGALTPEVITATIELARKKGVPTAVDPKKRNFLAYTDTDLFKPNLKELREGLKLDLQAADRTAIREAVRELEARLRNTTTLLTLSEHGVYVHRGDAEHFLPAHRRRIADVSGAGDTVIAVAALLLAQGADGATLADLSNLAGGLVCEHVGVVPVEREAFLRECRTIAADT
ncbi:MAG: D-glycero-beta-D-manno-heptose-7-phosphate kinase [Flavobacteriales bacterium]|nr:D-glycero-beta-D-manno-heptose-7-phosphate kinase [Flavobacteriales bacterium]